MSINIYGSVFATSPTPVLISSNPVPDGAVTISVNYGGQNLYAAIAQTITGTCDWVFLSADCGPFDVNTISGPLPDGSSSIYVTYTYSGPSNNGFYVYSDVSLTGVAVGMFTRAATMAGTVTCNNIYNSSGLVLNPLTWCGSTTTASNGTFSIDISSAGFSTITSVQVTAQLNTGNSTLVPLASVKITSTTTITGNVIAAGALGGGFVGSGITVYVTVYGS